MELDQLLNLTSTVAGKLLPILGAVVLFFLIQFFRRLVTLMVSANEAVKSLQGTLDSANKQLDLLEKPMQTLNEISETVDNVHEASKSAVRSVIAALVDQMGSLLKMFNTKKDEAQSESELPAQNDLQVNIQVDQEPKQEVVHKANTPKENIRGDEDEPSK
ncbi:MAG: histidine kinase [Erysipelotrichaceae bacterium]|nr:histidine kinase [Erysipelotrichaceae bacterium]MCI9312219.1 histidine kinase [Erysipelotrichaceae bacterium]